MENSPIEWTDHTWSPWMGCSGGCAYCYAARYTRRFHGGFDFRTEFQRTSAAYWRKPMAWERAAASSGRRPRVFPSLCDPFDILAPLAWFVPFMELIRATPHLDWLLLTKQPKHARNRLRQYTEVSGSMPTNIWLGVTAETQAAAEERIPVLLEIPVRLRLVSIEPMLGPVFPQIYLARYKDCACAGTMWISDAGPGRYAGAEAIRCDMARHPRIHWVIAGPQTGPGSEPCDPEWVEALADQCACAKTPFFDKRHHFIRREFPKSTQA